MKEYAGDCRLQIFRKEGKLCGVWIEFSGDLSRFPSMTNSRPIFWNKKTRKPFIGKSKKQTSKLEAITKSYDLAVKNMKTLAPMFLDEPLHVMALLSVYKGRWDSHNASKAICDWLQSVAITNDDSHIECEPKKKSDYPPKDIRNYAEFRKEFRIELFDNSELEKRLYLDEIAHWQLMRKDTTTLIIQPLEQVKKYTEPHIYEIIKESTKILSVIG